MIADEIWSNITLPEYGDDGAITGEPRPFVPFAAVRNGAFRNITVTCTSASKAFNMAGIQESHIVIENPILRQKYKTQFDQFGLFGGNFIGPIATEAAYEHGGQWLDESVRHIASNVQRLRNVLARGIDAADDPNAPRTHPYGIRPNKPEAT